MYSKERSALVGVGHLWLLASLVALGACRDGDGGADTSDVAHAVVTETTLVAAGDTWKYLDDGSDQGSAWRALAFDDAAWQAGPAQLGYGDGDESTVVSYGSDSKKKYLTTYFRKTIQIADASAYNWLDIDLIRDDGAVVYINGVEAFRDNMPTGYIDYRTRASSALGSATESDWVTQSIETPGLLLDGANVIAVEVHQRSGNSSDMSFDLQVVASDRPPSGGTPPPADPDLLLSEGSAWRYLDDGSDQGVAWRAVAFDDGAWAVGGAQLGYGDGDENTVVSYGPSSSNKHITTYFRTTFEVPDPAIYNWLDIELIRDDGAVVYVNGVEVWRENMPSGTIDHTTVASSALGSETESSWVTHSVATDGLVVPGQNTVAVEMHQRSSSSSDMSFDLRIRGSDRLAGLARGPYLQLGTPESVVVRWRTDAPTDTRLEYGLASTSLTQVITASAETTEHQVTLTGLSPDTTYYYAVGHNTEILAGGDEDHRFTTAPAAGTARDTRIWILGDSGTADSNAANVRDAFYTWSGSPAPDLWLMLGDNAYNDGTDAEYQRAVFDMYPATLRSSVLWTTLGNHDAASADSATGTGAYYDMFTLPANAQAGGLSSGTEAYYSFDYGNIHLVSLDSHDTDRSPTGAMMTWLAADLAATSADWIIAYWHHPPYSKGSHDSDTETRLIEMRETALPILEDHGVDLVLSGHSHSYERSVLLDSHYDTSDTLVPSMVLDPGDGRLDGMGAYAKATMGPAAHEGAVYVVAGSSGKVSSAPLDHPAMHISLLEHGSVAVDVVGNRMHVYFIDDVAGVSDYFTVEKGAQSLTTRSEAAR